MAPETLTHADKTGVRETQKAIAFYAIQENRSKSFSFKAYKHDSVKLALNEAFSYKCAYCESSYWATQPVDIEHYRPKGEVIIHDQSSLKPGYYWLAADWENLLPSCIDCNRARYQEKPEEIDPELLGKANLFPIDNDARASLSPGMEANEQRLLVHPSIDAPEDYFSYRYDNELKATLIEPNSFSPALANKSLTSIKTYGLERLGLSNKRGEVALRIFYQIYSVKMDLTNLHDDSLNEDFRARLAQSIFELRQFMNVRRDYVGMARYYIEPTLSKIEEKLHEAIEDHLDAVEGATQVDKLLNAYPPDDSHMYDPSDEFW